MSTMQPNDDETFPKALKNWVNHGLQLTMYLVQLGLDMQPTNFCSGFLIRRNGKRFVLSAGHGLGQGNWYLQTHVSDEMRIRPSRYQSNGVFTLQAIPLSGGAGAKPGAVDFAWCEVSFKAVAEEMKNKPWFREDKEFLEYTGPLDTEPLPDTSGTLDPQLHTHVCVMNVTYDPKEQRWKAVEPQGFYKYQS